MKLSLIVVNYNACAYLKLALTSLISACNNIDYELIIVENASAIKSLEMISTDFPAAHVIINDADTGISTANNEAIKTATGEYVLLVNPDTITSKDSLQKMVSFMDDHADAGGLSVRMVSPQGRFLSESIHGLNKTWAAFFKLIGFAKHLPKTRLYNRNRKDWVEEFQVAEIDILNSACMLLRQSVLNGVGLFDERFFMFGHNIDLSYRIRLAGFKNYYFPKTYIINFETLQLPKFSWKYIKYFYGAMLIFAYKYLLPEVKIEATAPEPFSAHYEVKG